MRKSAVISVTLLLCSATLFTSAQAGDFEWSGSYRAEFFHQMNPSLDQAGEKKEYGLHHLILSPKIIMGDGLNVYSRFNIFNNNQYPSSQLGSFWGGQESASGQSIDNNPVTSKRGASETLLVSHLYLTLVQEFGSFLVGRAPLHFGLGATYNAGLGDFDHWSETRDVVGYKFVAGNFYFLPMIGKVSEGAELNANDDITDYMLHLQYENFDTDTEMGIFYGRRKASSAGHSWPQEVLETPANATKESLDLTNISLFYLKDSERFRFGIEATQQSGKTGRFTTGGDSVKLSGSGVAAEFEWRPLDSKFRYGVNFGFASGDDPGTTKGFEGFFFSRNYEVSMLLFNHHIGQEDFLRSAYLCGGDATTSQCSSGKPDILAVTNAAYASPYLKYMWTDKWNIFASLTTGWLNEVVSGEDRSKDLGYELDISTTYKPTKRFQWVNRIGWMFSGAAFEGGDVTPYDASSTFGFETKAAISF